MGSLCSALGAPQLITDEQAIEIGKKLADILTDLPGAFLEERENIVWEMYKAKPEEYEDEVFKTKLKWDEYPKCDKEVCILAIKVVAGDQLKDILGDIVHAMIDDQVEAKLATVPPPLKIAAQKGLDKAIETIIDKAVDKVLKEINKKVEEAIAENEGEEKEGESKGEKAAKFLPKIEWAEDYQHTKKNSAMEKMKAKGKK